MSVFAQARRPQVFRDEGAFDRRAYLAQQNVHLLATLRSSSLLERIFSPPPTMATRLARLRAQLRQRLDALYPNAPQTFRLQYKDRSILLPGDAEKQAEYAILSENDPGELHADVLKVGHHGSKNSTMPEFLEQVNPQIAIISAGEENPYGHPSPELLERLQANGVRTLRTDQNDAVQLITDGRTLRVNCFLPCREEVAASGNVHPPDRQ